MLKRDIQGKFALKNDDYRQVRSLRLTDDTWKALGIAAECLGITRADYLEEMAKSNNLPSNTWEEEDPSPCITRGDKNQDQQPDIAETHIPTPPNMTELEVLRDQVLQELKLGKQSSAYKTTQKALNQFITLLSKRL
ncbi:hypothetical protein A0J48_026500 [Sphaerospermopsis aphanizomenoides BCCUSP55]|uniref:hypothetical protein n=1 Tax=Sphaerospermopsis aphanizomenoides TaxID=459663 RepID=UPI0019085537|nr:hypothetical protein [Sphaerospermopsis aphanizomenoides]MBK1991010.1 hypothetical protein [Sphaerospermopsis aphanizomenoides BCCUSP55]